MRGLKHERELIVVKCNICNCRCSVASLLKSKNVYRNNNHIFRNYFNVFFSLISKHALTKSIGYPVQRSKIWINRQRSGKAKQIGEVESIMILKKNICFIEFSTHYCPESICLGNAIRSTYTVRVDIRNNVLRVFDVFLPIFEVTIFRFLSWSKSIHISQCLRKMNA